MVRRRAGGAGRRSRRRGILTIAAVVLAVTAAAPALADAQGGLLGKLGLGGGSQDATESPLRPIDGLLGGEAALDGELDSLLEDTVAELDSATRNLAPELGGLLAQTGLLGTVGEVLCPLVTDLGAAVAEVPVAAPLIEGVRALVCNLGLLEFRFFTVWEGPGGERVERVHDAVVGVPTALDVDPAPGPELTGTISVGSSFDSLTLAVERAPGSSGPLPVSVEALIDDPTGGAFGADTVAFGYDQLDDTAPDRFETVVALGSSGEDPSLDVRVTQQGPGEGTALTGSFFDGSPGERDEATAVRIDYERSPTSAGLGVTLADPLELSLATDVPGPVSADLVDRADGELDAAIEIEDLPSELTFGLDAEQGEFAYAASAPVARVAAVVTGSEPLLGEATDVEATFADIPEQFELAVGGETDRLELVSTDPIGRIDLRAASAGRELPEIPAGESGAVLDSTADELGLAVRVFGLRRLAASLDPIVLESELEAGRVFTVDARIEGDAGVTGADVVIDELPAEVSLAIEPDSDAITYAGSGPIDRLEAAVDTPTPLFLDANHLEATLLDLPQQFEIELGDEVDNLSLSADQPIGEIDLAARSDGRGFPSIPAGEAGTVFDATAGELGLRARVFELEQLDFSLDPIGLDARMQGGRVFTVDARLDREPAGTTEVTGVIDRLPSELSLGIDDLPAPAAGTRLSLEGSDPIDFVRLAADGLELLEGADDVEIEIDGIPTDVAVDLPEEGPLATIDANAAIGQLRLAASDGGVALPERSVLPGDPVLNDLFSFSDVPGDFGAALRLSAVELLSIDLDPVNVSLEQDQAQTRAVDLDAALDSDGDPISVAGLLDKPGTSTSLSVELEPDEPTRLVFDNSHNMDRFELAATGLGGIGGVEAAFDNLPPTMSICMDPGPACQRPNPNPIGGGTAFNNRPYQAEVSMDFDDMGSHGAGSGPGFRTTLNAEIELLEGDPVEITNLRFRNLAMDFGQGPQFSGSCTAFQDVPRLYMFFASRSHPWVMNSVKYPPLIQDFRLGTDGNPARSASRIAWLRGCTGFLGASLDRPAAGGMSCGGQSVLDTELGFLGTVNILDIPLIGSAINLCGGSVPNPQPW